jgi:hypothetical protein
MTKSINYLLVLIKRRKFYLMRWQEKNNIIFEIKNMRSFCGLIFLWSIIYSCFPPKTQQRYSKLIN